MRFSALPLLCCLALAACANNLDTHGHILNEGQIAQLEKGVTTQAEVRRILGSPSSETMFDAPRWIYVTEKTQDKPLRPNMLREREILVVDFDKKGIFQKLERKGLQDGHTITPEQQITPTQGQSLGILDQLLGNIGRGF